MRLLDNEHFWVGMMKIQFGLFIFLVAALIIRFAEPANAATIQVPAQLQIQVEVEDVQASTVEMSRDDIRAVIKRYSEAYGVDFDDAIRIAQCESSLNSRAQNPKGTAKGLYQFTDGTWKFIKAQGHQFDIDENVKNFMIWYPVHPGWWECR